MFSMRWTVIAALMTLIFASGCATPMATMAPARVYAPGTGQVTVDYQVDVSSQLVNSAVAVGKKVEQKIKTTPQGESITDSDFHTLLRAALVYELFPPLGSPEIQGRVGLWGGILKGMDVGIRYNGDVVAGDARLQVLGNKNWAATLDVGYGYHTAAVPGWAQYITLTDWGRSDYKAQLDLGFEIPDILTIYVAPRVILSRITATPKISDKLRAVIPQQYKKYEPSQYFHGGNMLFYGVNGGILLGYKYVFLNLDLSVMRVDFKPTVLGQRQDYGGLLVSPAIGLTGSWD